MTTPYFVFSTLHSDNSATMQSWVRFRTHIQSVHPIVARPDAGVLPTSPAGSKPAASGIASYWRLLASNNREVARSYFLYSSFTRARVHVEQLLDAPDALSIVTLMGADIRTHGWYATLDGVPVMTCSRWYGGSSAAYDAARATVKALGTAVIVDGTRRPAMIPAGAVSGRES
ncbi:hypothetical protein [Herbiconiux sp. VKM Ac-2851]|uniref:hypothetical protein n=1 Tax=Herbiconiux sp. VKM Ac-2851 TaxID=2739025 RepID=UPI001562FCE4|nr:hypothetical protein [Herbiconiux sp. VKM Ac-2851]NQX36537.1 hypothetical protein [Herbiconiux sp. VKM Ac-2851]